MSSYGADGDTQELIAGKRQPIAAISGVVNLFLIFLYGAVVILHIVCLAVMAAKRNEIVGKFKDDPYFQYHNVKEGCILFFKYDGSDPNTGDQIKWVNNKCHLVIYGSGALGGCALLMVVFLILRTILFRKINFLVLLDAVEVVLTGLFAGVLAVIITLGKNETCKSAEKYSAYYGWHESCEDFHLRASTTPEKAKIYAALRTAQVTSLIAVGVIGVIGIITMIRVFLWFIRSRRRRGSVELNPPLVEHDQLGGDGHLRNVLSNSYDDDKPLHP